MDLAELLARESIRDLVTRYNANGDSGRFAHVIDLFAADAMMVIEELAYEGHVEIMKVFTGAQGQLSDHASDKNGYVRHFTSTHQIDVVDEDSARGRCYFAVITEIGLDHWGQYVDTYRQIDGRWLFSRREVRTLGYDAESLYADAPDFL